MKELKNNQPFHNHKHSTRLATLCVYRFTCSRVSKPYYRLKFAQYLEAYDRKIIEMVNTVTPTYLVPNGVCRYHQRPQNQVNLEHLNGQWIILPIPGGRRTNANSIGHCEFHILGWITQKKFALYARIVCEIRPQNRGSSPDLSLKLRLNYFRTYQFPRRKSNRNI